MNAKRLSAIGLAIGVLIGVSAPVAAQAVEDPGGIVYEYSYAWSYLGMDSSGNYVYTNGVGELATADKYIGDSFYGTERELAEEVAARGQG
ncbi:hypothetical protein ACIA8O_39450 [Kitasatospora sp. NPDC051853]|uniref:hypothetical protein n=1 Tax=Kitasatospora sp. NPDC051853 TaxID=3364058 RepID=UPI0037A6C41E